MKRTYKPYTEWKKPSLQTEYTKETPLLKKNGTLNAKGWAKHNVFTYERDKIKHPLRRKEWDFYQISNGRYMVQISFANISIAGYVSALLLDLETGKVLCNPMNIFLGGKNKNLLPEKGDVPNTVDRKVGNATFRVVTTETERTVSFRKGKISAEFTMQIPADLENITTVLPFNKRKYRDRYFMTTKQNCMPTRGTFRNGRKQYTFSEEDTYTVLDWGRVCTPYKLVWYWGNGSAKIKGPDGDEHLFGFEITWGIGDESNATETCVFYDGKAHKFGAVDVETFPKPDQYMEPWKFVSEDGRFDLTMTPTLDHHSDLNLLAIRMNSHQVHGKWNGTVTLEDGTKLEIKDMYAFCEYVENRW